MSKDERFWTYDRKQSTSANFETTNCICKSVLIFVSHIYNSSFRPNAYTKFNGRLLSLPRVLSRSRSQSLLRCYALFFFHPLSGPESLTFNLIA